MKIWLDDMREAPLGWIRCRTRSSNSCRAERSRISLDYDKGLVDDRGIDWNGEDVLKWIERQVVERGNSFRLPVVRIHSANPVGRQRLQRALDAIQRRAAQARDI